MPHYSPSISGEMDPYEVLIQNMQAYQHLDVSSRFEKQSDPMTSLYGHESLSLLNLMAHNRAPVPATRDSFRQMVPLLRVKSSQTHCNLRLRNCKGQVQQLSYTKFACIVFKELSQFLSMEVVSYVGGAELDGCGCVSPHSTLQQHRRISLHPAPSSSHLTFAFSKEGHAFSLGRESLVDRDH